MFDLGVITDKEGMVTGEIKCLHCQKRLCDCPERQPDGKWKAEDLKPELDALKERISLVEKKVGVI